MLAHPRASLRETAFYFNVSISWLSIIKTSDAFKELWEKRRNEHFSNVSASVAERVTALAEVSVDALTEQLEKEINAGTANIDTLKEVSDMALKSLGFGGKGAQTNAVANNITNNIQNNNIIVDKETLSRAREARKNLQRAQSVERETKLIEMTKLLDIEIEGSHSV